MMFVRILLGLIALSLVVLLPACHRIDPSPAHADPIALLETDRSFCQRSLAAGMKVAFVEYADTGVIKMDDGQLAIRGIDSLRTRWAAPRPDGPSPLFWAPQHADISSSGDMGYTFGYWRYPTQTADGRDTIYYGNYVSIWKRQADGSWKYVLDTGTNTPKPMDWH